MRIIQILISAILINLLNCSSQTSAFKAKNVYMVDGFNENTLSGSLICAGPLFNQKCIDIIDSIKIINNFQKITDIRKDLKLISLMQIKGKLTNKIGSVSCDSLFSILCSESVVTKQLLDTLWQLIDCDFLMVIRIKDAMSIKTFDDVEKKRIYIEAELWKCKDQEIVWRTEAYGIADGKVVTDREIIDMSIQKIYQELPLTVPSYENEKW
jgi:hypothetical protein